MSTNIFDILIIVSGLYLIYAAVIMKKDGIITSGVLISKDMNPDQIRDKEGFIKYMFVKVLALGILTCLVGGVGFLSSKMDGAAWISFVGIGLYFVVLIFFLVAANKAKKLFVE